MENLETNTALKKRRRREKAVKKWTEKEICIILDYIQEAEYFEKPTAQIFYRKLLEQKPLDATWELIRWKVRSLKTSFIKATGWEKSTGVGLMETEQGLGTVQAKVLKICPHYDRLKEIFGDKSEGGSSFATYEVPEFLVSEEEEPQEYGYEIIGLTETEPTEYQIPTETPQQPRPPTPVTPTTPTPTTSQNPISGTGRFNESIKCAEKLRKFAPKTAIGQLSQLHAERQAFQEKKLKLEHDKPIQSADIEEKKINLEQEKMQKATAIKERKLQLEEEKMKNDLEIRKLQIEKEERIAMRELELKYKNNHNT